MKRPQPMSLETYPTTPQENNWEKGQRSQLQYHETVRKLILETFCRIFRKVLVILQKNREKFEKISRIIRKLPSESFTQYLRKV